MARQNIIHPGFPRIGAIERFRRNSVIALREGDAALTDAIRKIPQYRQEESGKSALRVRVPHEDRDKPFIMAGNKKVPIVLNTYIDKNAWKAGSKHISDKLEKEMRNFMFAAMSRARNAARGTIHTMPRAFKSQMKPRKAAAGDLYEKIAESLDFEETETKDKGSVGRNQFISFIGASRADGTTGTLYEMGVRGRRMSASDKSLIELTEAGFPSFEPKNIKIQAYYAAIRRNPAKRFGG
jgi:hypothetical protein